MCDALLEGDCALRVVENEARYDGFSGILELNRRYD